MTNESLMRRALDLARQGEGFVEPNPMVGCVIARGDTVLAEGYHARFGGPHAEVVALANLKSPVTEDVSLYVTLEPCCHHGKTPPCTEAILRSGVRRVVVAQRDPFPSVDGRGMEALERAGIHVEVGCLAQEAAELNAPYLHRLATGTPWFHGKWAMTWDGRIAADNGQSQWISGPQARSRGHQLRGRMDGIVVGIGTVLADDPLLTARPAGPRIACRIVLDSSLRLPPDSRLVRTAIQYPLVVFADESLAAADRQSLLRDRGVEVHCVPQLKTPAGLLAVSKWLGERGFTHVLVEGGSQVLGSFFAAELLCECHLFISPKLLGGASPRHPLLGPGVPHPDKATTLQWHVAERLGDDLYLRGRRWAKRDSAASLAVQPVGRGGVTD